MPTKAQIESTTLALRKSVARWNKYQLKLNKADEYYKKIQTKVHAWERSRPVGKSAELTPRLRQTLRKAVDRWNKAKAEFNRAEQAWVSAGKKYRAVHSKLPHGHWMK